MFALAEILLAEVSILACRQTELDVDWIKPPRWHQNGIARCELFPVFHLEYVSIFCILVSHPSIWHAKVIVFFLL